MIYTYMNIFKRKTEDMSAKDFTEKKRNNTLYLDCVDSTYHNNKAKRIAWNSNKDNYISTITSFNNHSNRIKITKGYFDHFQTCENDPSFFSTAHNTQEFRFHQFGLSNCNAGNFSDRQDSNVTIGSVQGSLVVKPEQISNDPYYNFERNFVQIGNEDNVGDENKVSNEKIKCIDLGIKIPIKLTNYWLKNEKNAMLSSVIYPFTKDTPDEEIGHTVEDFAITNGTYMQLPLHINYVEQEDVTVKVVMQNKRVKEISIHSTTVGQNTWDCNVRYGDLVKIDLQGNDDPKETIILRLKFDALTNDIDNRACY